VLTLGTYRAGIREEWCGKICQGNREARRDKGCCGERSIVICSPDEFLSCFAAVYEAVWASLHLDFQFGQVGYYRTQSYALRISRYPNSG